MSVNDLSKKSRTDWRRLESMSDDEIDVSDIPPLGEDFFQRARLYLPMQSQDLVQVDADVLNWFKTHSRDYQTQINRVLRQYIHVQPD
ncbi:MAG: BrnA antitoxin family protein [Chloroflexi bacterium]|nr:BrnA antitoxin family protein [Chloroflexota bacterium]